MAIETDVLVVGAGPAGLAAAIALKRGGFAGRVVVVDKGRSPGSHVLSGAVMDPSGFAELLGEDEVAKLEERVTGHFSTKSGFAAAKDTLMGKMTKSDRMYLTEYALIANLAATENCVIVGRSGNAILADNPHTLHLHIFADDDFCGGVPCIGHQLWHVPLASFLAPRIEHATVFEPLHPNLVPRKL